MNMKAWSEGGHEVCTDTQMWLLQRTEEPGVDRLMNWTDHHRFSHDSITALLKLTTYVSNVLRWHDSELINCEFSRDLISNHSWGVVTGHHVCAGTMGPWSQWWGRMWAGQCLKHYYLYSPRGPQPFIHLQSVNPGQPNYQNDWVQGTIGIKYLIIQNLFLYIHILFQECLKVKNYIFSKFIFIDICDLKYILFCCLSKCFLLNWT